MKTNQFDIVISEEYLKLYGKYVRIGQRYADAKYIKKVSKDKLKKLEKELDKVESELKKFDKK